MKGRLTAEEAAVLQAVVELSERVDDNCYARHCNDCRWYSDGNTPCACMSRIGNEAARILREMEVEG